MSGEGVRKAIADYAWSQRWRHDRRRLDEAIRGAPDVAVCAECSAITGIQQECDWLCSGSS